MRPQPTVAVVAVLEFDRQGVLNTSNHARLAQIIHTLRSVHGFDLPTDQSHKWHSLQEHYQGVQSAIVESSTFNSYHTNPEYTKAALITEAVRILFEIAPRRRKRSVKESNTAQESTMTNLRERKARPDFLDLDKDGDRKEPMKQAAQQAKHQDVEEAKQDPEGDALVKAHLDKYGATKAPTKWAKNAREKRIPHHGVTGTSSAQAPGIRPTSFKKLPGAMGRVKEERVLREFEETVPSDDAFAKIKKAGAQNVRTTSDAIVFSHKGAKHEVAHHNSPDGHRYVKLKDLNAKLKALNAPLMEDVNLDSAETLLAAKDISDRLQNMAEDAAKMAVDRLMPLVDTMKSQFGQQPADGFNAVVKAQLQTVLDAIIAAKDETDNAIMALQGGGTPSAADDISSELPAPPPSADAQQQDQTDTDFDNAFAAMPATSGDAQEPLGRTMKSDISEAHDGHKFQVGDRVEFDYARGMRPLKGEVVEIVTVPRTQKNPLGYTVDVRSGNNIYSLHPNHPVKLDEAQNSSPTQELQAMAATGKDKNGRPLNPMQKQAMTKAAADLAKAKLEEKLTKKMTAAEIIQDFVNSDDPKFRGKSKKQRTQMALGAYYGMHPEKQRQEESIQQLQAVVESLRTEFHLLQEQFNQHKAGYKQAVMEGTASDPLGTGYGIQGSAILQKMRTIRDQIQEARAEIADIRDTQRQQLMMESATVTKLAQLAEQKQTTPHGVVAVTIQGTTVKKFFESVDHRNIWMQYNQHTLSAHKLIDPQDLDAVSDRLAQTLKK